MGEERSNKKKNCEIMQYLQYIEDWGKFLEGLANPHVNKWAYVIHDKDVYLAEDERKNPLHKEGEPKPPHVHCMLQLDNSWAFNDVGSWFGVPGQYVGRIKSTMAKALAYLTHANDPQKHRYDDSEVLSNYEWVREREVGTNTARCEEIIAGIDNGTIREFNLGKFVSMLEYTRYKARISSAFEYRMKRLQCADDDGTRTMECIYIRGESGAGKTTYAKMIARDRGYSLYVTGAANDPLENYMGQDCIILDDIRPSVMGLSDLLKMLDNNTRTAVSSRYRNKFTECKTIIITTTLALDTFFNNVFEAEHESVVQLRRRCQTMIDMKVQTMSIHMYDGIKRDYQLVATADNPVKDMFPPVPVTEELITNRLSTLPGLGKVDVVFEKQDLDIRPITDEELKAIGF